MAFAMLFSPKSMNPKQYDDCISRLEKAGAGAPKGRLYHASFGTGDKVQVFDVWESMESFQRFGEILMPILGELGVDPGQPDVKPIHKIIEG